MTIIEHTTCKFFPLLVFLFSIQLSWAQADYKPVSLRCEYLENPLGIDASSPRFTWRIEDVERGSKQSAWQIFVSVDSSHVEEGSVWNSGKVEGSETLVVYTGKELVPFTKYFWKVYSWDRKGERHVSVVASFETGMMKVSNWTGAWISDDGDVNLKPAPYFRKQFNSEKKIKSARVYIAAAGLYELSVNGNTIGKQRLDPGYTRFDRRLLYVTHDVTSSLRQGPNAIGVLLGNGWYNHQSTAVWDFHKAPWRGRPAFCLDLRITYEDGSAETITSSTDWKTSLSPLIFNSIYTAEHYDARLEQNGWNTSSFDDSKWKNAMIRSAPTNNIVAQVMHPIRYVEKVPARSVKKFNDTTWVFDLGRNIAGVSEIRVHGNEGTVVRLKHGEKLYPDGRVDLSNIDVHFRPSDDKDPFQTDILVLNGRNEATFKARFNYKGFQFVEVTSSQPLEFTKESLTGYFMHSDVPPIGNVTSSNPTLDKIWKATNNAYLSNLFGYPTDCPQREKNGWTGDAHIAVETGLFNFDAITVYEKWMADHRDEQQPNGVLPAIIPSNGWGYHWANGPDWTSTIALIPWNIYLFYGDSRALMDCYPNIKRYVDHINEVYPSGLTTWGLGDWVPVKSKSPVELTSSLYYFADVTILAKAAALFGNESDYEKYNVLARKIKDAINNKYLNKETGVYGSGMQTELSAPLFWGVVPEELKAKVAYNLAEKVKANDYHIDVGILGAKAILNALSENGYADVAYRLAAQETFPSWGYWIKGGATTLYENWDIESDDALSMNHIMFGEVGAWIFKGLGGIRPDPEQPGFKNIILEPHFVTGLNKFSAEHEGPFGMIISSWQRTKRSIFYSVTIPSNTTATLRLNVSEKAIVKEGGVAIEKNEEIGIIEQQGQRVYRLGSGRYEFEVR